MDMLLSNNRVNVNMRDKMRRICLHWAGNYGMARLAELLLYRTNIHMDIVDDNGDTETILPAKMEHASVVMLMLDAGCCAAVVGVRGRTVAHWAAVHGMLDVMKKAAPLLSLDTLNATDAERSPLRCAAPSVVVIRVAELSRS